MWRCIFIRSEHAGVHDQAIEFREVKSEFDKLNAIILGCMRRFGGAQAKFKAKQKLKLPASQRPRIHCHRTSARAA